MGPAPLRWALRAARKRMSVADLQELEEVKLLVVKGQATGVLTYAEVATALAEVELDEGDIEELHGYFEKSEIELVEDDQQDAAQHAGATGRQFVEADGAQTQAEGRALQDDRRRDGQQQADHQAYVQRRFGIAGHAGQLDRIRDRQGFRQRRR